MNMQEFLDSLVLLKKDKLPTQQFPLGDIQYLSVCKRNEIEDQSNLNKDGQFFMKCINNKDNSQISYIQIDEHLHYIKQLDSFNIDLRGVRLSKLDIAFTEALSLFDELAYMENNPYIACHLYDGIASAFSIYDSHDAFPIFNDNPLIKEMYFSQFQYFVKKYTAFRLNKEKSDIQRGIAFNSKLRNAAAVYLKEMDPYKAYNKQFIHEFRQFIKQTKE